MDAGRISTSDRFERSTPASGLGGWLLRLMLQRIRSAPIRLVLGDGTAVSAPDVTPRFTVWMRDIRTLAQVMLDPDVGFGEGWTEGRIRVTGDLVDFIDTAYQHIGESQGTKWYSNILSRVMSVWQANTQKGSKRNIRSHYDLGNEFYRMWLDRQLVYTCAYYPSPSATLEAAQIAKMDHVCRKLRLQPGETVIEVGCGWGALALHMAREYGVRVKAFNISHQQIQHARERAREEQLDAQVEFIEDDYRNVSGRADAFVSIGMLEHVGRENYCELGRVIKRTLGDHGRGLLHFIGRSKRADFSRWIRKRIFPGAYAPSLDEALDVVGPFDYLIRDVEDLRPHYAKTLEHWLERFERSAEKVTAMYGASFERAWRLYLAGSIAGFRGGRLQLFQILFSGPKFRRLPWTRDHLYAAPGANAEWTSATS